MKSLIAVVLLAVPGLPPCWAQSAHEMSVGAQTEQICGAPDISVIAAYLKLPQLALQSDADEPSDSVLVAAACKTNPADREQTFVAVAYDAGAEYQKSLILAVLQNPDERVVATYQGHLEEDAATRMDSGSLWIDTAAYLLAPGVRAFGLDVTSGYVPNCGDGGSGAERSLYVQAGDRIQPVLQGLTMSTWHLVQRGQDRCNSQATADTPAIIERSLVAIRVGAQASHGYRDLLIDVSRRRDDATAKAASKPVAMYTLQYDGTKYVVPPDL